MNGPLVMKGRDFSDYNRGKENCMADCKTCKGKQALLHVLNVKGRERSILALSREMSMLSAPCGGSGNAKCGVRNGTGKM